MTHPPDAMADSRSTIRDVFVLLLSATPRKLSASSPTKTYLVVDTITNERYVMPLPGADLPSAQQRALDVKLYGKIETELWRVAEDVFPINLIASMSDECRLPAEVVEDMVDFFRAQRSNTISPDGTAPEWMGLDRLDAILRALNNALTQSGRSAR